MIILGRISEKKDHLVLGSYIKTDRLTYKLYVCILDNILCLLLC